MDCIVKIQLKEKAPVKKILNIFKANKAKERAFFKDVDHDIKSLKNVLCIPYGQIGEDPQIVTDFIIVKLTELYGLRELNHYDNKEYSCYYINNTQTFITENNNTKYGLKVNNPDDFECMDDETTLKLHKDESNKIPIMFVSSRTALNIDEDCPHIDAVKDAYERADFLIYDHVDNK